MPKTMTPAAIAANRRNAQKSTGPRTPEGKARASRNNLRHGLHSRELVIPCGPLAESSAQFEALRAAFHADLQPTTAYEAELVDRMARCQWLAIRAHRFEANPPLPGGRGQGEGQSSVQIGNWKSAIGNPHAAFDHPAFLAMVRFENRLDRIFHRTFKELHAARQQLPPSKGGRGVASPLCLRDYVPPCLSKHQNINSNPKSHQLPPSKGGRGVASPSCLRGYVPPCLSKHQNNKSNPSANCIPTDAQKQNDSSKPFLESPPAVRARNSYAEHLIC